MWKLWASTTFEILPLSTCSLCQQKSPYLQKYSPIFEIFASARRCWEWAFGWKVSGAEVFYFWNGKAKTLRIDNIWNFATFNLYTLAAKILYLQRYSNDLRNLCLSSKMLRGGHLGGKFQVRRYFTFAIARRKLCASTTFEILPLSTCTLWQQNSISPKVFKWSSKSLPELEYVEGGHFGGMFQVRRCFTFAIARRKLCASTTFEILPLTTCTLWQQKSYTTKSIQLIFEIFAWARRCWGWAFGWNVSGAEVFYFCNGKVKTLRIENIWNFADFQHVHCASKNPISRKVFNQFSKSLPQLENIESGHLGGKFHVRRYFTFAIARRKLCASTTFEILPLSTFTLCQQKPYTSKSIQPIFEIFPSARRCWWWAFGWKRFRCAGILLLQWQGEKFAPRQHLQFCRFQPVHCASQNPVSRKVFNRFSKSLPQVENFEGRHLGGKFHVRRYFTFAIARRKLCASTTFEILPLTTCTLWQQKSYTTKSIQLIFEIFAWARRCWRWAFGCNSFRCSRYFTFAMARRKLCASTTFEILPLSTCTLRQQKSYMSKGIQTDLRNLCLELEDV